MTEDPRITILRKQIEDSAKLVSGSTELAMSILDDKNGLRLDNAKLRKRLINALIELQNTNAHLQESRKQLETMAKELESLKGVPSASGTKAPS